ncbi:hypothetical protein BD626DRAFT_501953 [Schizophyllum amplum]|uniref:Fungal-type protein kinase domain-containing protein n=1 Tax=Schizophyllum amplum TaxID=97359 RepID=A0A550C8Y9_9AGAR|nr:hypothetical protein BD626DRAFT_501953 [Auriculariopsis ampla]
MAPSILSTPPNSQMHQSINYTNATMPDARNYARRWIDKVPEVDVDTFIKHFMPERELAAHHTTADIAQLLSEKWLFPLRNEDDVPDEVMPLDIENKRWTSFDKNPDEYGQGFENRESEVFKHLEDIFDQVVRRCKELQPDLVQTTTYCNGDKGARSEKKNSSRRDADFRLVDGCEGRFYELAVIVQLKKASSAKYQFQNWTQINWELLHVARTEPGRRFCFGMTIENLLVRLWHLNREIMVVSKPFNFMTDYKTFIEVLQRFAFARKTQLGYDPTFEKFPPAGESAAEAQFVTVDKKRYRIIRTLANYRADAGLGRCSWVWLACDVQDPAAKEVVVKDCWMANDRPTEFEILEEIRELIEHHPWAQYASSPSDPRGFSERRIDPLDGAKVDRTKYFVNITAGDKLVVDKKTDDTRDVIAHGFKFPSQWSYLHIAEVHRPGMTSAGPSTLSTLAKPKGTGRISSGPSSAQPGAHVKDSVGNESEREMEMPLLAVFERGTEARAHHRMVMEYAEPLSTITDPSRAFRILRDVNCALFILHCIGFVHRDGSYNNILDRIIDGESVGALSDLEYARKLDETVVHLGRTGTEAFMAVEVADSTYLNLELEEPAAAVDAQDILESGLQPQAYIEPLPEPLETPWRFCEMHDIESILWVALYVLFRHTPFDRTSIADTAYDMKAQAEAYTKMFPGDKQPKNDRRYFLQRPKRLKAAILTLPPKWQRIGNMLSVIRGKLMDFYSQTPGERKINGYIWRWASMACQAGMSGLEHEVFVALPTYMRPAAELRPSQKRKIGYATGGPAKKERTG